MAIGGSDMAISDLHCVLREEGVAVIWSWDSTPSEATITVTRLLDDAVLAKKTVGHMFYNDARLSPSHGPVLAVPAVPLRVTVADEDGSQSVEVIQNRYVVEWRFAVKRIYKKRLFRSPVLLSEERALKLRFPCEGTVPSDLFYYALVKPGHGVEPDDPIGYLPALESGMNTYGMLEFGGRQLVLCCNPRHEKISRLFDFKQRETVETE